MNKVSAVLDTTPRVHAIVGPTGSGKTAHATALARSCGAPVVVADRIQCFTDLTTTSARATEDEVRGVARFHLGDRTVADGDYPADSAGRALFYTIGSLSAENPLVILEGGSISVLRTLAARHDELPFRLTVETLGIRDGATYEKGLRARARQMLQPEAGRTGMLDELAAAWKHEEQRPFIASINGLEAILEWCDEHGATPQSLVEPDLPESVIDDLVTAIGRWHAVHGREQEETFSEIFSGVATE